MTGLSGPRTGAKASTRAENEQYRKACSYTSEDLIRTTAASSTRLAAATAQSAVPNIALQYTEWAFLGSSFPAAICPPALGVYLAGSLSHDPHLHWPGCLNCRLHL